MIRKTFIFAPRLLIAGIVLASGLGIVSSPKVAALGPSDPICRAVIIVDRSDSVHQARQENNVMREVRNLPARIAHPKIHVAFWSFAGWSRYVSSDDNDWNINRSNQDFNLPRHGYISTTGGTPASWNNAVNSMNNWGGEPLFKRNTYYDWAFGYTNGGNGDLSSTAYNPQPNNALHATGIPAQSDVLVFTTDGEPDQRGNERRIVAERYLSDPNHPRSVLGAVIPADFSLDINNNPVNLMVNGNRTVRTDNLGRVNVFRVATNYSNFATSVASLINNGCDYKLTPTVENVPPHTSPSQPISPVRGKITNASSGRKSEDTEWHITRVSYPPSTITTRIEHRFLDGSSRIVANNSPCVPSTIHPINHPSWGLNGVTVDCNWRSGNQQFIRGDTLKNKNDTSPSQLGGITCYFLSVKPTGWDESGWSHSPLECVMAVKSPVLKVTGGDLRAIQGQINVSPGGALGSWVEYGVFSVGANTIGSAGSYNSNSLTFANNPTGTSGNFWSSAQASSAGPIIGTLQNLSGFDDTDCSGILADIGAKKRHACTGGGILNIPTASNITGQHIINAPGRTVTITGNITYSNDCGDPVEKCTAAKVPQVVIIADRIQIDPGVTNIDAWLIAQSSIATCNGAVYSRGTNGISTSNCGQVLRINGPVITTQLQAFRAGSGDLGAINDPVEIFNLRPDAYMWLYTRSNSGLKLHTNAIHELPPRY